MRLAVDVDGLRRAMAMRGMDGAELAAIAGVCEATVSHAMTGRKVSLTTIRKLARGLTVTPTLAGADGIIPTKSETVAISTSATASSEVERVSAHPR
jgi:transcriptional regulator with XRE-family HTH domain